MVERRGGYRPTAPQNNFGASSIGGNGSAQGAPKQPMRVASGGNYGDRKAMTTQQSGAPMAASPQPPQMPLPEVHPLTGDTGASGNYPTHGSDFGRGAGSDVLPQGFQGNTPQTENTQIVQQYGPSLVAAMSAPNVPDSYKRFVNALLKDVHG